MQTRILRALEVLARYLNWIPLLTGSSVIAAFGAFSAWIAARTAWLNAYGPIAWWGAALMGSLIGMGLLFIPAAAWSQLVKANAIRRWNREVDSINPLDLEFNRKRIRLTDLENPISSSIKDKRFIDCEVNSPATIVFIGVHTNKTSFVDCDFIVIRPNCDVIKNVIQFHNIQMIGGSIARCTIYLSRRDVKQFKEGGASFVSFTGDPSIDGLDNISGNR